MYLLVVGEDHAGRLFAVPQRGVINVDAMLDAPGGRRISSVLTIRASKRGCAL